MNKMMIAPAAGDSVTMSSLEIARLTEKDHRNVMADIRKMMDELGLVTADFSAVYKATNGQSYECFELPRRECDILVAGYSIKYRAAIVDRWRELESKSHTLPDFSNPAVAARAWADEVESKQAALAKLEQAKPAIEFVDRFVAADSGSMGFRQVCKLLNARQPEFRQFLKDKRIMYRLGGEWVPYQQHIEAGRFVVKAGVAKNDHAFNTAKFTAKGVNWVASLWVAHIEEKAA